jgi:DNA-binding response OmpR family regulator
VDDEPMVRRLFERVLSEDGYLVTTAATGRHGLLLLRDTAFDLIILDMSLPDVDGVELMGELRVEFPELKVLAVSGFMSRHLRDITTAAGATVTLGKPAAPGELRRAVYRSLDGSFSWQAGKS